VDSPRGGVRRYLCDRGISTRVVDAIRQRLLDQSSSDGTPFDRGLRALAVDEPVDVVWTIEGVLWRN